MKRSSDNITEMQNLINELQRENAILKDLLKRADIPYEQAILVSSTIADDEKYAPDQGKRIHFPSEITDEMASQFYARFWGRMDVFARRNVNRTTGAAGYYTQCENFWTDVCPKKNREKIACSKCQFQVYKKLKKFDIINHLAGKSDNGSDVIGVYPLLKDNTCRFLVFDFDNHEKDAEKIDFANQDDAWKEEVRAMVEICKLNGIEPLVERSRSGRGAHVWIFFEKPIPAKLARQFGFALLDKGAEQVNLKSFRYYDRMLPMQDTLKEGELGNLIALPLQGLALRNGNSAFVDNNFNAYPDQWSVLMCAPRLSKQFLEEKLHEWKPDALLPIIEGSINLSQRQYPWKKEQPFFRSEVIGKLQITIANGIYVDTLNLQPSLQNKIRRLALLSNPVFYKNKAGDRSNYATSQWIYLGCDDIDGYIELPRGLLEKLVNKANDAGIDKEIHDERETGRILNISFNGTLKEIQIPAVREMSKYENGILQAATAYGKTVVSCALIAEKKVSALVVVEKYSLLEQWKAKLEEFLTIDEELPTYLTKTGKVKTRKSLVGKLQSPHDSLTGIVDVAMAGSLFRKGEFHPLLQSYGMVIFDECHHAASQTVSRILKEIKARYVYGVTATPERGDDLHKINFMLIGPVRFKFTAKDMAMLQDFDHFVYPRFTRAVPPRGVILDRKNPNEAYEILRNNEVRDRQIVEDIRLCIADGRTPLVLTRYKDHANKLYNASIDLADHVFLLTGDKSRKENDKLRNIMEKVSVHESLILVATGSLIGEGFDFSRLDTLIMATPVSKSGVVEQYAGRINRDYIGKKSVIIYDYVDYHIPMFANMYKNRLKTYKKIGYKICTDIQDEKQVAESIFDGDSYKAVFVKDINEAKKRILISASALSGVKVRWLIDNTIALQQRGVEITVLTRDPDSFYFDNPVFQMQLLDEMRQNGIFLAITGDWCQDFAIIDEEIVWYGNIHLLGKDKTDDNIMRVMDRKIAGNLLEFSYQFVEKMMKSQ